MASDSDDQPWVCDLDGVWHRRPPGDGWTVSIPGPNARTICGLAVASVSTSGYEPQPRPEDDERLCRGCDRVQPWSILSSPLD